MDNLDIDLIETCECCGESTSTTRNRKTGEYLCWECQTAIAENEKFVKKQIKKDIKSEKSKMC